MKFRHYLFPLLFVIGAAMISLSAYKYRSEHARLVADAVASTAEVLSKHEETHGSGGKDTTQSTSHIVRYRFTPEGGGPIEGEVWMRPDFYDALKPGDTLKMHYKRDEPGLHEFEDSGMLVTGSDIYDSGTGMYGYMVAGLLVTLAGIVVAITRWWLRRRVR